MRKHLGLILRLTIGVVGLGFIIWSLTWQDHVVLPGGYQLNGYKFQEERHLAVEEQRPDAVVLEPPAENVGPVALPRSALDGDPAPPRFEPGILTTLREVNPWQLALSLVLVGLIFPLQTARWLGLMRCRGMQVTFWRAFRLTMAGHFFNFWMPGTTGGDVVKAYYTAKGSDRQGTAIMSVLFDRVTGMTGLTLLAGLVGLTLLEHPLVARITAGVWLALAAVAILAVAYFSSRLRAKLRPERLTAWLPGRRLLGRVDEVALAYRQHKLTVVAAIAVSLPVHGSLMTATALAGQALGIDHPLALMVAVLPVVFLAGSVPITPQGIGVMEWLALTLLEDPFSATANQIVGMLLLFRLCLMAYALIGSLLLVRGDIRLHPQDLNRGMEEADGADPDDTAS